MITLTNGYVQTPGGLIVPNGSITFQLNVDGTVIAAPYGIVLANEPVVFQFDATGNLPAGSQLYSNAELQPQNSNGLGTYYLVTFYDANGARLNKNPMWWQFPEAANSTVNISAMTPYAVIGGNIIFYPIPDGGGGTVTSVAFVGDGTIFSTTPSAPVTSVGDLGPTLLTQNANTFLAGPLTGVAADPTFRAITAADLPVGSITGTIAVTQVAYGSGTDAITGIAGFTFTAASYALEISNGTIGSIFAGAMDAEFAAATPSGVYAPVDYGVGQANVVNRFGALNASGGSGADTVGFSVINQDSFVNSLTWGGWYGMNVNMLSTCASNLNFTYSVFPGGIVGGLVQSRHIGTGTLTGTNFGVVGLITSAAVQSTTHVGTVVSLICDTGGFSGATVDNNVAIWIPSLSDVGTTLGTGIGLYMAPVSPSFTTLWGLYIDGTTTPNFFGGSSSLKAVQISNIAAATSGANQSSPLEALIGQYWTGSASAADSWTIQDVLGSGTNPTSTLVFSHSGSTGANAVRIPSTPPLTDSSTNVATTAFVQGQGSPITTKVTLTASQILNLSNTPVIIAPAPGAGKYIIPIACSLVYNPGTTVYSVTRVPVYGIYYDWTANSPDPLFSVNQLPAQIATITGGTTTADVLNLGLNTQTKTIVAPTVAPGVATAGRAFGVLENLAIKITNVGVTSGATVQNQVISGQPSSVAVTVPGAGYAVNDVITLGSSNPTRRYTVTSVDGFGGITGLSQTTFTSGINYGVVFTPSNYYQVAQVSSAGVGALLQIVSTVGGENGCAVSTVNAAGTGYDVGDTGTITANGSLGINATYTVLTLTAGAGSGVATYQVTSVGASFFPATGVATAKTTGAGTGFTVNVTGVGGGYASGDTGSYGNGTYTVNTVDANGNVLTYTITSAPTNQVLNASVSTTKGGAQPGAGVGLTFLVTQVANDATTGNGTVDVIFTYLILSD